METLKRLLASRAQIARAITALSALLASFGLVPDIVPLLGPLADAISRGEPVAVIGAVLTLAVAVFGLFDRDKKDRAHDEVISTLKSLKQ